VVRHEGKYEDQPKPQPVHPLIKAFLLLWVIVAMASLIASVI
jgi:hypothetical protein